MHTYAYILFFYKDGFGITLPTKVDMPLKNPNRIIVSYVSVLVSVEMNKGRYFLLFIFSFLAIDLEIFSFTKRDLLHQFSLAQSAGAVEYAGFTSAEG